jgi:hypothetical protein
MTDSDGNAQALAHHENPSPLQGQVLRRSRRREAVLFLRDDTLWVADFIDGHGEVTDAVTWIRFNCAAAKSTQAQRRMVLESAIPLSEDLVARIEALQKEHRSD